MQLPVKFFHCVLLLSFLKACQDKPSASSGKNLADTITEKRTDKITATVNKEDSIVINKLRNKALLVPQHIVLQNGIALDLEIPQGYHISVAYEGLQRLRFLAKAPDGKLFATDMKDRSDNREGKVYFFKNWDSVSHRFTGIGTYLQHLHNPNQVAFYTKGEQQFIYVAETGKLSYYPYHSQDSVPAAEPVTIASFPDYGLSYKYGGWHLTRSLAFHGDKLYVSVGSSCNACIEKEAVRATVMEMNPDGTEQIIYASGLRNAVGIKWVGKELWATNMGRDLIGPDKPEDLFLKIDKGVSYNWPFYFQYQNKIFDDTAMQREARQQNINIPPKPPLAYAGFKAHAAPLGFDYFQNFSDPYLDNAFLVALHGSTSVWRQRGNAIVKVIGGNIYEEVVTGFLTGKTDRDRKGRPCDILMNDDHSFFFTDDLNGVLYYVWKER